MEKILFLIFIFLKAETINGEQLMSFGRTLPTVLVLILVFSIVPITAFADEWGKLSDEDRQLDAPADYPEADAVMIFSKGSMLVSLRRVETEYYYRIKILTTEGVEEAGDQSFWFHSEADKIKSFKAQTITPDGKKHKVEKDAIFDKVSGVYIKRSFSFPALEPGSIIEYKYTHHTEYLWWLDRWYFQSDIYTLKSTFSVELKPGFGYDYTFHKVPTKNRKSSVTKRPDPSVNGPVQFIKTFTWEMKNLPPVKNEPYMGSVNDYMASMHLQLESYQGAGARQLYNKSWSDVGDEFCNRRLTKYCNKQGQVKKLANEIVGDVQDNREKSTLLHKYVTTKIATEWDHAYRYFGPEDRMSNVLNEKLGTPAEKNLLLVKLHEAIGLDTWPVMISTRSNGKFSPRIPSTRPFNYMVAVVQFENHWEFLDASNRNSHYGLLPANCLTDGGLLLDGKNSELVKMTIQPANSYRADLTRMYVSSDGEVACSTYCEFGGYLASLYGNRYETHTPEEFAKDYFLDRLDIGYTISDQSANLDSAGFFTFNINYTSDELTRLLDENLFVKQVSYIFYSNPFESEERFFAVDFDYTRTYQNIVEIHFEALPTNFTLPKSIHTTVAGASFEREAVDRDSVVIIGSKIKIDKPSFRPVQYKHLRNFFAQIATSWTDEVIGIMPE